MLALDSTRIGMGLYCLFNRILRGASKQANHQGQLTSWQASQRAWVTLARRATVATVASELGS